MAPTYPVSVKGVVVRAGAVLLLRNERAEWELPGGRLEAGEAPEECVVREVAEECGWTVLAGPLLDVWVYPVRPDHPVLVVTYGCHLDGPAPAPVRSAEHLAVATFPAADVPALAMPDGYKRSIARWFASLDRTNPRVPDADDARVRHHRRT